MEQLIYDRTIQDVRSKTNKGYHNYTDLNRVETWCDYLANELTTYGYVVKINTKKDWDLLDERTESEIERIRQNLIKIRTAFCALKTTPATPSTLNRLDYTRANNIEQILHDIDYLIRCMTPTFIRCGVPQCGQDRMWQFRFLTKDSIALISDMSVNTNTAIEEISSSTTYAGDTTEVLDFPLAKDTDTLGGTMAQSNTGFNNLDEINGKGWN